MPVAKLETTGSTNTYDSSLGNIVTRVFQCWLADADALWAEFSHNQNYPEYGGYFIRTRSSIDRGPGFATARLVFAEKPDVSLNSGASGSHEDGDTEYNFTTSTMEKQLEAHPDYKTCWNYELLAKTAADPIPASWSTATTHIDFSDGGFDYKWVKPGTVISGWALLSGVSGSSVPGSPINFSGVEAFLYPAPVLEVVKYYRDRDDANAQLQKVGYLAAPSYTGSYESGANYWLITSSSVVRAGKYWICRTNYTYADIGWNTKLYSYAV